MKPNHLPRPHERRGGLSTSPHAISEIRGAMSHIWPSMQTVTVFCRVDIEDDAVKMDDQHSAYKWITEATEDLHPYLKEMIQKAEIFR